MTMKKFIIGIDGDVDKSGIAVWDRELKTLELSSLTFFQLFDYLQFAAKSIELVKIEAGWKHQKQNYHGAKNAAIGAKIGSHVGANAESGRKIIEMCEYLGIPHKEVKPLRKIWKNGKISHAELQQLLKLKGIPEIIGRTNQEERDSALICLNG